MPTKATKPPIKPTSENKEPSRRVVRFKYLRNITIIWSDGEVRSIPVTFRELALDAYNRPTGVKLLVESTDWTRRAVVPQFDLEHEFEIDLSDADVTVPVRGSLDTDDELWKLQLAEAYENVKASRSKAKLLCFEIAHHVGQGNIRVTHDSHGTLADPSFIVSRAMIDALRSTNGLR